MTKIVDFNPDVHDESVPLYELQSARRGEQIVSILVPADVDYGVAVEMPWHYVVKAEDVGG